ncbi:hypothetical protein [Tepidanaerobacter syntrophicus]|jgi:hypothetical protein|uniref:Uncharacterized protein n=1 Tax=Tepidanaerobacter syntrophicus TaxID=224999 RepID=A0A0U9HE36_9FIRM|nr:hypothetical protein [Tepidanaerobacter syntrophicus]GAQ25090.1 hypothetical protein TSYNT_7108 [Tepidanaerobacter syntrophicus]
MFMVLGLTGMVGFVVCLVVFIISLIRKKSKKPSAIGMVVCFTLFFVGLALTPPAPEKTAVEKEPAPIITESTDFESEAPSSSVMPSETITPVSTADDSQSAESSSPSEPSKPFEPTEPTETQPTEVSETVFTLDDEIIPGLKAADIKLNLVKWGLKEASSKKSEGSDDISYISSVVDSETGADLSYFIMTNSALNVKYATFSIINLAAISEEDFLNIATGYLGYCATVPFDGAEPEKSKQWIEDNIKKCNEAGKIETLNVGNVEFSLYGTGNSSRYLEIKPIKNNPQQSSSED